MVNFRGEREKKGGRSKEKAHTLKTTVTISIVSKRDGWCC